MTQNLEVVLDANSILGHLSSTMVPSWNSFLQTMFPDEYATTYANLASALRRMKKLAPEGVVAGSMAKLKTDAKVGAKDQKAFQLLKKEGCVLQVGRSGGRAMLIIDSTPLDVAAEIPPLQAVSVPLINETAGDLLSRVTSIVYHLETSNAELVVANINLSREREDLILEIDTKNKEIQELQNQVNIHAVTSWL